MMGLNLGSWKTAGGGIVAACCFVFIALKVWNSYLTGVPVDIDLLVTGLVSLATTVVGIFGRDNNVTSEDVGIK